MLTDSVKATIVEALEWMKDDYRQVMMHFGTQRANELMQGIDEALAAISQLAEAEDDKKFWVEYGYERNMQLVEARAHIEELEQKLAEGQQWLTICKAYADTFDTELTQRLAEASVPSDVIAAIQLNSAGIRLAYHRSSSSHLTMDDVIAAERVQKWLDNQRTPGGPKDE